MACEGAPDCPNRDRFAVQLLTVDGPVTRRSCDIHLAAAVTWAHEVAALRVAVDPNTGHWLVAVTPIDESDVDEADEWLDRRSAEASRDMRQLYMDDLAAIAPPGRDEPGLVAWTQRAFYHDGCYPPTPGRVLAGLILWPLFVIGAVVAVVALKVPMVVTPTSISHAVHNRFYPDARDQLFIRAACSFLILLTVLLAYIVVAGYWRTRPLRGDSSLAASAERSEL